VCGVGIAAVRGVRPIRRGGAVAALPVAHVVAAVASAPVTLASLFAVFVKIGALVFGSGYVLLAFLRADLVERLHWLTEQQLLDAVAIGQMTPGPVFTTATFIGYLLAGGAGAAVATVGIFLPAFVLVAVSGPFVSALRGSRTLGSVLDGVTVGAVALMAVVTWQLARAAVVDVATAGIAVASILVLLRFGIGSTWLIAAGALIGVMVGVGRGP
jgi:chromate transporter